MRRAAGPSVFLFFGLVTAALTWPVAVSLDHSFSVHADYFSNLWNIWWIRKSLFELGVWPYWTDFLFFPEGVSLARHTLSLANSLPGALLSYFVSVPAAFNVLTLAHFWLGAWAFYLLAHHLTGNRPGSVLAGLIYAFCPFHYFYLPMINIVSMECLPLATLFFMKTHRDGGARNSLAAAGFTALTGATCWYYLPYLAFLVVTLSLCGRLWAPEASILAGGRRVLAAGVAGAALLSPLAWPLVAEALSAGAELPNISRRLYEGHDLLGFFWIGPPERLILSWPSAIGYSGLALLMLGSREIGRAKTWLIPLGVSWLLGLGGSLRVGGMDTGIPLPHAWLVELPVLTLLRRPDRLFILVQLAFAVLCAYAWAGLAARIRSRRLAAGIWVAFAAAVLMEFGGAPLRSFSNRCSPYFRELEANPRVVSVVELPLFFGIRSAKYVYCQTVHEKKIPQGYVTNLAITPRLARQGSAWRSSLGSLDRPRDTFLPRLKQRDIDLVVLNKRVPARRPAADGEAELVWRPFGWVKDRLVPMRQIGGFEYRPLGGQDLRAAVGALRAMLGEPIHEDELVVVFPVP